MRVAVSLRMSLIAVDLISVSSGGSSNVRIGSNAADTECSVLGISWSVLRRRRGITILNRRSHTHHGRVCIRSGCDGVMDVWRTSSIWQIVPLCVGPQPRAFCASARVTLVHMQSSVWLLDCGLEGGHVPTMTLLTLWQELRLRNGNVADSFNIDINMAIMSSN